MQAFRYKKGFYTGILILFFSSIYQIHGNYNSYKNREIFGKCRIEKILNKKIECEDIYSGDDFVIKVGSSKLKTMKLGDEIRYRSYADKSTGNRKYQRVILGNDN